MKNHYSENFVVRFIIITEGISYFLVVPATILYIILSVGLNAEQISLLVKVSFIIAILTIAFTFWSLKKILSPILIFYNHLFSDASISDQEIIQARKALVSLPHKYAITGFFRFSFGIALCYGTLANFSELSISQHFNFILTFILFIVIGSGLFSYTIADILVTYEINKGAFSDYIEIDKKVRKRDRLSTNLSFRILTYFAVIIISMIALFYNLSYKDLYDSFVNQIINVSENGNKQIESFLANRQKETEDLSNNLVIQRSIKSKKWNEIFSILNKFIDSSEGYHEAILLVTFDKKPSKLYSSKPDLELMDIYFCKDQFSKFVATEKSSYSFVFKSPISQKPASCLLVPIKEQGKTIAIIVSLVSLGDYTREIVGSVTIGETGYMGIMDSAQTIIGTYQKEKTLENLSNTQIGKKVGEAKESTVIHYFLGGHKVLYFVRSKQFPVFTYSTIQLSDIETRIFKNIKTLSIFSFCALLSMGFLVFYIFTIKLKPLSLARESLDEIAHGNLKASINIYSEDEIGLMFQSINLFISKLKAILMQTQTISSELNDASSEMKSALLHLSDTNQTQAASSEEVTSSVSIIMDSMSTIETQTIEQVNNLKTLSERMEDLSSILYNTSQSINETNSLVNNITTKTKQGETVLNDMQDSMVRISESSEEMIGVIEIINTISGQINLLALNASIEAARAGESGRGFAVVAAEVSKLAEKTAKSIGDIDTYIQENETEIKNGLQTIKDVYEIFKEIIYGIETIHSQSQNIKENLSKQESANTQVHQSAEIVKHLSEFIKDSILRQRGSINEIAKATQEMNNMTQQTASSSEEISAASENLTSMAFSLKQSIEYFKG